MTDPFTIYIGFDPREMCAVNVAQASLRHHCPRRLSIDRVSRLSLCQYYERPTTELPNDGLWDDISQAPMSTDHAIARFFVPFLMGYQGWALFVDGDVLMRRDVYGLMDLRDPRYAIQVVQHPPQLDTAPKKTGVPQVPYPRKNWSSVMIWNCAHPAHAALTLAVLNTWPGRDLHAFRWLTDDQIGGLPAAWNYLVGVSEPQDDPALVHYTLGTPNLPGHAEDPFAAEWFAMARRAGYRFEVRA